MPTNERVKQVLRDCSQEQLKFVNTGYIHQRNVDYDEFAQQVVGETITAILATDLRSMVHTSFDKQLADSITSKVIDSVRNHWSFK